MELTFLFFLNAAMFGVGLAMDAFSVSLANGLHEPGMRSGRMCRIAGVYAFFQIAMPLIGWFCVHAVSEAFSAFQRFVPWIALILLCYIGGNMLREGIRGEVGEDAPAIGAGALLMQGLATSIDALSVGFTIAEFSCAEALIECAIIGAVTFFICLAGLAIGKRFGTRLAGKASVLGGVILIAIGLEILLTALLG